MREFKFRAWDKTRKLFFPWGFNVQRDGSWFAGPPSIPDAVQSQYTGLKDKNGKEIWEADIATDGHRSFIVEYNISMAGFMATSQYLMMDIGQNAHILEVVGNIYENPKLLGAKT